jgi:hypothetical protein
MGPLRNTAVVGRRRSGHLRHRMTTQAIIGSASALLGRLTTAAL